MKSLFIHKCVPAEGDFVLLGNGQRIFLDKVINFHVNILRKNMKIEFYIDTPLQSLFPNGVFRDGNSVELSPISCNLDVNIRIDQLGTVPAKINSIAYHNHKHFYLVLVEANIATIMEEHNYQEPTPKKNDGSHLNTKNYTYIDIEE